MHWPTKWLAPAAQYISFIAMNRAARLPKPIATLGAMKNHIFLDSMSSVCRQRWLHHAIEGLPGGDLCQLMRWITTGEFVSVDGALPDWSLSDVFTPMLVIAAAEDSLIDEGAITEAYERLGSSEKRHLTIGRAYGASRDYRHADVLLAPAAVHDVYPHIVDWLGREDVRSATTELGLSPGSIGETSPAQSA
jgi:alpha-beta hydrolase superfamily lysophospholipase